MSEMSDEALSWCWGVAEEDALTGIVDGNELYKKAVTRDIYEALRVLRYKDHVRYLWVDAICIDQTYRDERSNRVDMMNNIYGRAWRVCIWVVVGDQHSQTAVDLIRNEVLQLQNLDELCNNKTQLHWPLLRPPRSFERM